MSRSARGPNTSGGTIRVGSWVIPYRTKARWNVTKATSVPPAI
jgi:hypothetical protein